MTVYVDNWRERARPGRGRDAIWSHLRVGPGDALAELHSFAGGVGLQRRWFQGKKWPHAHYDVTDTMRQAAIAAGAMPVTWQQQAGRQLRGPASQVTRILATAGVTIWCLGTARNRQPVHPLYQPGGAKLIPYKPLVADRLVSGRRSSI